MKNSEVHVLVIDDEEGPRESVRCVLKSRYKVDCVDSVDHGIQSLREKDCDVIILDMKMPGKSGLEALRTIRQMDPRVAVIILTGIVSLATRDAAMRLGANAYMTKPFEIKEMRDMVAKHAYHRPAEVRGSGAPCGLYTFSTN